MKKSAFSQRFAMLFLSALVLCASADIRGAAAMGKGNRSWHLVRGKGKNEAGLAEFQRAAKLRPQ